MSTTISPVERLKAQLVSLGFDPRLAGEGAARFPNDINLAIDFAGGAEGRQWLQRQTRVEMLRHEEQQLHDEMAQNSLTELLKLNRYPEAWVRAAVNILNPTPKRCAEWIEEHREALMQAMPTEEALRQHRRADMAKSVRVGKLGGGLRRTHSEEFGYSQSIVKDEDLKKKYGAVAFRPSVTGRDLTPLPLAAGYLQKQGKAKTYQWRYCAVNNEYFNYYKDSDSYKRQETPSGSYSLLTVSSVELQGKKILLHFKTRAALGNVHSKTFKAKKPEDAQAWVTTLRSRLVWFAGLRNAEESGLAFRELVKHSLPLSTNFNVPVHAIGPDVVVDGPLICKTKDGWDNGTVFLGPVITTATSGDGAEEGAVYEWTFRTHVGTTVTVGVAGLNCNVNALLNRTALGWGYYLNNGNKGNKGEAKTTYGVKVTAQGVYRPSGAGELQQWRGGATVTVRLDTSGSGSFGVVVNGQWQGTAYANLKQRTDAFVCGVSLCRAVSE
jgi:hypothetical protein